MLWSAGKIEGVKARSGFELNFKWKEKEIVSYTVLSVKGGQTTMKYNGKTKEINLKVGEQQKF